jgi:hypothetical protein
MMDGEADDFVIDDGELVPVVEEEEDEDEATEPSGAQRVRACVMISQDVTGELSIQLFGCPTQELVMVLNTAMKGWVSVKGYQQ